MKSQRKDQRRNAILRGTLLLIAGGLSSLAALPSASAAPLYDNVFPTYAEYCASSRIKSLNSDGGGAYGHTVMYLKGACRDQSSEYPRIKSCSSGGVGLSVNNYFKNVNWVAVEEKDFFFSGGQSFEQPLTKEAAENVMSKAIQHGYAKNIRISSEAMKEFDSNTDTLDHFKALQMIGTDYALDFGRNVYCVRLPVTRPMMQKIVDYYNSVNEFYYVGGKEYNWHMVANNCTHTAYNALAAAGFWKPKNNKDAWFLTVTSMPLPINPYNIAVPFNVLIDTIAAANDSELPSVEQIYDDPYTAKALVEEKDGWMLNQPGALVEQFGIRHNNQLYDTNSSFKAIENSLVANGNPYEMFNRQFTHKRYGDLKSNLEFFRAKILRAQAKMKERDRFYYSRDALGRYKKGTPYSLRVIFDKYEAYLIRQLEFVDKQLAAM